MGRIGIAVVAAAIAAFSVGCGKGESDARKFTVHAEQGSSPEAVKQITVASDVLFKQCQALGDYLDDVVDNTAKLYDADGFSEKADFGWSQFVEFDFALSEKPRSIPSEYRVSGNHCRFRVSGDELSTQTALCAHLCQGKPTNVSGRYSLYTGQSATAPRSSAILGEALPRRHYYALKDGPDYGYEQAVSEEARRQGRVASPILMFKYLGERDGVVQFYSRDGQFYTVMQCERPCEFVKSMVFYNGQLQRSDNMRIVEGSIAWGLTRDAFNGHLAKFSKERNGKPQEVWFDSKGPKWRAVTLD